MSVNPAKEKKKIIADISKFKKLYKTVKKFLSKELLWMLFVIFISIPMALGASAMIDKSADLKEILEILSGDRLPFITVYVMCAIGVYISRMVAKAIIVQLENKKEKQ